jgi:hypothetical protein
LNSGSIYLYLVRDDPTVFGGITNEISESSQRVAVAAFILSFHIVVFDWVCPAAVSSFNLEESHAVVFEHNFMHLSTSNSLIHVSKSLIIRIFKKELNKYI